MQVFGDFGLINDVRRGERKERRREREKRENFLPFFPHPSSFALPFSQTPLPPHIPTFTTARRS
jgi:hypothetical protein